MAAGVILNLGCVAVALSGIDVLHFSIALVLLGIGWNFMFIGGTTLLTESHSPAERSKVQGVNDLLIFITMAMSSLASGLLFTFQGWALMNQLSVPFLLFAAISMLLWRRTSTAPELILSH